MATIISIVIALIVAGFVLWAAKLLIGLIPLDPFFRQIIDVLITILVVAIVIFFVVIPLLNMLAGLSIPSLHFH